MTSPHGVPNVVPIDRGAEASPVSDKDLVPATTVQDVVKVDDTAAQRRRLAVLGSAGRSAARSARGAVSEVSSMPELWTFRRPSLKDVAFYAWFGDQTGEDTLGRRLSQGYALFVSLPITTVVYLGLWVIERPARLFVVAPLLWLALSLIF